MKNALKKILHWLDPEYNTITLIIVDLAMILFGIPFLTVVVLGLAHFWKFITMYLIGLMPF